VNESIGGGWFRTSSGEKNIAQNISLFIIPLNFVYGHRKGPLNSESIYRPGRGIEDFGVGIVGTSTIIIS
jgi:hypothetical protein